MIAFKPDLEKIKMARDHVAKIAADWPVNDYFVRVVTSELVTNAVRHARTDEIRVDAYADGDAYVVEVWDGDGTLPVMCHPRPDSHCGRGLLIVAKLATRWGARRDDDDPGKVVYAEWTAPTHMPAPEERENTIGHTKEP